MRVRLDESIVLDASIKCFAKYGYKKTTLADIAQELNMHSSSLYSYAPSKRALYGKAVRYLFTKWQSHVTRTVSQIEDSLGKLRATFFETQLYLAKHREFAEILHNDPSIFPIMEQDEHFPEVADINKRSTYLFRKVLEYGIRRGDFREMDVETVTKFWFSIYRLTINHAYVANEEEYNAEILEAYFLLISEGILKR